MAAGGVDAPTANKQEIQMGRKPSRENRLLAGLQLEPPAGPLRQLPPDATTDERRQLCEERLHELLACVWPKARAGSKLAIDAAISIIREEIRLWGLAKVPTPDEPKHIVEGAIDILEAKLARLIPRDEDGTLAQLFPDENRH
jgi:hypothetical protein